MIYVPNSNDMILPAMATRGNIKWLYYANPRVCNIQSLASSILCPIPQKFPPPKVLYDSLLLMMLISWQYNVCS